MWICIKLKQIQLITIKNTPSLNSFVISQMPIAYFSQNSLSPKKNDDGQKNTEKEGKQTLKGIPFEVCFGCARRAHVLTVNGR